MQVDHPSADDGRRRRRPDTLEDACEPVRERDVVGVHARDVPAARVVEADVERAGEAQRLGVPHHAEPGVVRCREDVAGAVDRPVVDDHQLEIAARLAEHAAHRLADRLLRVAGCEDDGHEGRGHGGLRVACAGGEGRPRRPLRPRRRDGRPDRRSRRPARRSRGTDAPLVPARGGRPERRRARRARPRGAPRARRAAPPLGARPLPGAERRARRADGRCRRVPGRRLPLSPRAPRTRRGTLRRGPRPRRRVRPAGRRGRPRRRPLAGAPGRDHAGHRLAHGELAHDLPPSRGGRARRRLRRGARARLRDAVVVGRGDRLPRARAPQRDADRVRPVDRDHAPGQAGDPGRAGGARQARRRERGVRARAEPLSGPHRRADARAAGGRRGRLPRPPRHDARPLPRGDARRPSPRPAGRSPLYATSDAKISAWRSSQSASA